MAKLKAIFEADYLIVGPGPDIWRGTFEEALALPRDAGGGIPAKFSPRALAAMLHAKQDDMSRSAPNPRAESAAVGTRMVTPELISALLSWVPAASRAGGLSRFHVVVERGQAYVCHETATDLRIPTTVETLRDAEVAGLALFGPEGWRGNLKDGVDHLPTDDEFDGGFTALGLQLMLQAKAGGQPAPAKAAELMDVAAAVLQEARALVAELHAAIDSGKSPNPEADQDQIAILRRVIIPELEQLPSERPEDIRPAERINFFRRLKTFVWDTRVIGLINLIVNIYTKM